MRSRSFAHGALYNHRMRMRASMIVLMALPLMVAQTRLATVPAASQPATKPVDYYAMSPDEFFKLKEIKGRIGKEELDVALLEAAIFQESNRERVKAELPAYISNILLF